MDVDLNFGPLKTHEMHEKIPFIMHPLNFFFRQANLEQKILLFNLNSQFWHDNHYPWLSNHALIYRNRVEIILLKNYCGLWTINLFAFVLFCGSTTNTKFTLEIHKRAQQRSQMTPGLQFSPKKKKKQYHKEDKMWWWWGAPTWYKTAGCYCCGDECVGPAYPDPVGIKST